jgi:16S rRNA processing protein RimM
MFDTHFFLGKIIKSHGLKGEVRAFFDSNSSFSSFLNLREVFIEEGEQSLRSLALENIRHVGLSHFILKFKALDTVDSVEKLVGKSLFLPLDLLPALGEEEFYYHEVIGFEIEDKVLGKIGVVKDIIPMPAQDLICVEYQRKEIFIPILHQFVPQINRSKRVLYTELPEGLVDVYLKP